MYSDNWRIMVKLDLPNPWPTLNTMQNHDTYLALEQAVMLPQDVADLATEEAKVAANLLVMQHM